MPMSRAQTPIFSIPMRRVEGFLTDKICFRDAKARTPHPGLIRANNSHNECRLQIWDKFLIKHEYRISKQNGEQFVDVTNDNNIIHRKGNIVPGAMTVSKIVLPLEILFAELEISSVNIKFIGSAFYGERTCNLFLWHFVSSDYIQIEVKTYQQDRVVATKIILGRLKTAAKQVKEIEEGLVNKKCLARGQAYFETLGILSAFYVNKNAFNKIMTEVAEGRGTYYRGLAIVNPIAKFRNSTEPVLDVVDKLISPQEDTMPLSGANKV